MDIYLVVFSNKAKALADKITPGIRDYLDSHYIEEKRKEEYKSEPWQFKRFEDDLTDIQQGKQTEKGYDERRGL